MKWWIEYHRAGRPAENYLVHTPDPGQDGFYRQTTSADAFRSREASRRFPYKDGKPVTEKWHTVTEYCRVERFDEMVDRHEWFNEALRKLEQEEKPFPEYTEVQSIWAFYKAIGYDYKKQKYAQEQPCNTTTTSTDSREH